MQSTVRFAEPEMLQSRPPPHHVRQHCDVSVSGGSRLPKISPANPEFPAGDSSATAATVYSRHGYSPLSSQEAAIGGYWKYPLPSKSFRVYVGPSLREQPPAGAVAASQPASRGSWARTTDADARPGQLQRSRTEPAMSSSGGQPFLPSRAQIFLRRRLPPTPQQQQLLLCREATMATMATMARSSEDEDERLRWTMSTQRHWQADRKGQQRNQGPFSREFTVHVTAPSNWMRMKWGRRQPQQLLAEMRPADTQQQPPQNVGYLYTKQAFGQQLQL